MVLVMFDPGGILWTHKLILAQCVVCVHYFANGNGTNQIITLFRCLCMPWHHWYNSKGNAVVPLEKLVFGCKSIVLRSFTPFSKVPIFFAPLDTFFRADRCQRTCDKRGRSSRQPSDSNPQNGILVVPCSLRSKFQDRF